MAEKQICPWCQSEIVWDEEIGPEDHCPFCENELKGYRTLKLGEDDLYDDETSLEQDESFDPETLELLTSLEEGQVTEPVMEYEARIEQMLEEQEELYICPTCQSQMLHVGTQWINKEFTPRKQKNGQIFLSAPFHLDVHLCPHCFEMKHVLSREDRLKCL